MADFAFDDINNKLAALKACVDEQAAKIKQQKDELEELKLQTYDRFSVAKYIRDDNRLILSAPEIIIGNVDREGKLVASDTYSRISLRGRAIRLQATGPQDVGGVIENKAAVIRNVAVDPGIDGNEEVLMDKSYVITKARTIYQESSDDTDCLVDNGIPVDSGIYLRSDTDLNLISAVGSEMRIKNIDDMKLELTKVKAKLTAEVAKLEAEMKVDMTKLKVLLSDTGDLTWGIPDVGLRTFPQTLWELDDQVSKTQDKLYKTICLYTENVSHLVEVSRKINALDKMKTDANSKKGDYKTKFTGASLNIISENVNVFSADGDGNIRDNATAGLQIQAPHIKVETTDVKGALVKDSTIDINTQTFNLSTANVKYSNDETRDAGDMPAQGDVIITSKNVIVQGVDNKLNAGKAEEEKLTAGSTIKIRAEKVSMEATDKEGKATGSVKVNAKDLRMRSMDVDPKTGDEKEQAAGGQMFMIAEKMFVGSNSKKTKLVQVAAEKVGVIGKDTAEIQQDGKAVVTLSGGNMTAGGSKVELKGNTTIEGNADIKGEAKAPKVTSDQVEAKSAFKSPNINDTMGAGVPGAAGTPSAKMKEEEAK